MLQGYLKAYVKATKRAQGYGIYYLDLFAGPGRIRHKGTDVVTDGSPLIALGVRPSFTKYFFMEANQGNCDSLLERVEAYEAGLKERVTILHGDCNSLIDEVLGQIPIRSPCFAFLDPYAPTDLRWTTIEKLASHRSHPNRKIELFILFPYNMGVARTLPTDATLFRSDADHVLDMFMPPDCGWREIYSSKLSGTIGRHEMRRQLVKAYEDGLRSLGYKHVPKSRLVLTHINTGRPLYFLVFASDHPLGEEIMVSRFKKPSPGEQLSMLDYPDKY